MKISIASVLVFLIFVALAILVISKDREAMQQAQAFCDTVKVGDDPNGLRERAIAGGAIPSTQWQDEGGGKRLLLAIYLGGFPLNRHICSIEAKDKVIDVQYTHLS